MSNKKIIEGALAPDFSLPDQTGTMWHLAKQRGKWVLIYFYPKDFTSGCTIEAQEFQKHFNELKERVVIVGISADSVESHEKFCAKHGLEFTLLSDSDKAVIALYGADGMLFARRVSFLIDDQGKVRKIYDNVDPQVHAEEILKDLAAFGA